MTIWKEFGILDRISKRKSLFREKPESNDSLLQKFSESIQTPAGGVLFSIVGGKLSEGINFSDDLGRGVIMVGLPFPNLKSTELIEKMKYLDASGGNGREYYENICMKQVNQCIGRAIRHRNDYACIVLLDKRYRSSRITNKLPTWIKECGLEHLEQFGSSVKHIHSFFSVVNIS
jgi:chromosome transmission fidelity protein 1